MFFYTLDVWLTRIWWRKSQAGQLKGSFNTFRLTAPWGQWSPRRSPENFCRLYLEMCSSWHKTNILSLNYHPWCPIELHKNLVWGRPLTPIFTPPKPDIHGQEEVMERVRIVQWLLLTIAPYLLKVQLHSLKFDRQLTQFPQLVLVMLHISHCCHNDNSS